MRLALTALAVLFLLPAQGKWKPTSEAKAELKKLRSKHGSAFKYEAFGYIAHACKSGDAQFKRTNRFLETYAKFAMEHIFDKPPKLLRVVSFSSQDEFYKFAGRKGISGYYSPRSKQLVNKLHDGLGTCAHEMTHALHDADWDAYPNGWFVEGFGALMENCLRKKDGTFVNIAYSHWRFPGVRKRIRNGSHQPLREIMNQKRSDGNSYAQGRWILTYIYYQGLLKKFVKTFRDTRSRDPSGITALEKVTGKKLAQFEKDWIAWSKDIESEIAVIRSSTVYPVLGVLGRNQSKGMELAAVTPGGSADAAKLKEGDLITQADGKPVKTMKALLDTLLKKKEGQSLKIEYKRRGKKAKATIKLDQYIDG